VTAGRQQVRHHPEGRVAADEHDTPGLGAGEDLDPTVTQHGIGGAEQLGPGAVMRQRRVDEAIADPTEPQGSPVASRLHHRDGLHRRARKELLQGNIERSCQGESRGHARNMTRALDGGDLRPAHSGFTGQLGLREARGDAAFAQGTLHADILSF
jgi:hypothetical protein